MRTRNESLDVLRGIAVLLVVLCHYPAFRFMSAGSFGVDLFFVLSGFLISGLLFTDLTKFGEIRLGRFFLRRGLKIYPAFYVFIGLTALLWRGLRPNLWIQALFLQNYLIMGSHGWAQQGWKHLWSLAVEEHFYIALPILLIVLNRVRKLYWIPRISLGLIGFCFFARIVQGVLFPPVLFIMFRTHLRIDALFAGVALGYLYNTDLERFARMSRWWLLPAGVALLIPAIVTAEKPMNAAELSGIFSLNLISFALILCWAVTRSLRARALAFVGRYSYSIYLWHTLPMLYFLTRSITLMHFAEDIVAAILLGVVMACLVEMPVLSLRERIFPQTDRPKTSTISLAGRTASA